MVATWLKKTIPELSCQHGSGAVVTVHCPYRTLQYLGKPWQDELDDERLPETTLLWI